MRPLPALPERIKRLAPLAFAVAMGFLAMILVNGYLARQRQALQLERQKFMADYREPIEVLVAARDLSENVTLEASDVLLATVPEKFAQPYASRSVSEVAGMVTVAPIAEGEQILLSKLRRPEEVPEGYTLSGITPQGKRAVTIQVDAITGVGGFVRPGDIVDILWTISLPGAQQQAQMVTLTLFQDVPVLAVGRNMVGGAKEKVEHEREYTVTLALLPQETAFLLFAREQGKIQLSLRPPSEKGTQVAVVPANINSLLETQLGIKATGVPEAKATREVEVYKGLERDVVVLSDRGTVVADEK